MTGEGGMREDYNPGDLGFDPLGLAPQDEGELDVMKTKELNNGRLAVSPRKEKPWGVCWRDSQSETGA